MSYPGIRRCPLEGGVEIHLRAVLSAQEQEICLRVVPSTGTGGPLEEHRNRRSTLGCPTQESGGPLEGGVFSTGTRDPLEGGAFSTGTGDLLEGLYPVQELEVHLRSTGIRSST